MKAVPAFWILVIGAGWLNAQVVVSRRTYIESGRTFAQLWLADAGSLNFRQLTHSPRDHSGPVCSRDGKLIYFLSDRDAERSRNSYGGSSGREVWVYDRQTGEEHLVRSSSLRDSTLELEGSAANGGLLIQIQGENGLRSFSVGPPAHDVWVIKSGDEVVVSPDGRRVALVTNESSDKSGQSWRPKLVLIDAITGQPRVELGKYDRPVWSPGGRRIAAFSARGLSILDVATGKEIEHADLPKQNDPAQDIVWSPDGRSLLVGMYGDEAGSGDPQSDYFLLNFETRSWTPALTARTLLWLPDGTMLLQRPYEIKPLTPGNRHGVWTSQLAVYDMVSRKFRELTSGLVLHDGLSVCGH